MRTITDREARAKAYAIVDEIQTRALALKASGKLTDEQAVAKAMEEMAQ